MNISRSMASPRSRGLQSVLQKRDRQRNERKREKEGDSYSKFTAEMAEVSECLLGNKSIRYLNSHYADVALRNKESIVKWSVRGKGGFSSEKKRRKDLIRELILQVEKLQLEFSFNNQIIIHHGYLLLKVDLLVSFFTLASYYFFANSLQLCVKRFPLFKQCG